MVMPILELQTGTQEWGRKPEWRSMQETGIGHHPKGMKEEEGRRRRWWRRRRKSESILGRKQTNIYTCVCIKSLSLCIYIIPVYMYYLYTYVKHTSMNTYTYIYFYMNIFHENSETPHATVLHVVWNQNLRYLFVCMWWNSLSQGVNIILRLVKREHNMLLGNTLLPLSCTI